MSVYVPDSIRNATQKQQVLWYLKSYGSLSTSECIKTFGHWRLAEYIRILRKKDGYVFRTEDIPNPNGGTPTARYYLIGGPGMEDGQLGLGLK